MLWHANCMYISTKEKCWLFEIKSFFVVSICPLWKYSCLLQILIKTSYLMRKWDKINTICVNMRERKTLRTKNKWKTNSLFFILQGLFNQILIFFIRHFFHLCLLSSFHCIKVKERTLQTTMFFINRWIDPFSVVLCNCKSQQAVKLQSFISIQQPKAQLFFLLKHNFLSSSILHQTSYSIDNLDQFT